MSAEPELCKCGHLRTSHGVDSDEREPDEVCEELGCPCERFVPMVPAEEESPPLGFAPLIALHGVPDPEVVGMLERMLASAKAGRIAGLIAVSFETGGKQVWYTGAWRKADALWAFEDLKHRLFFGSR